MPNTTWNPSDKTAAGTLSGGNLIVTQPSATTVNVRAVHPQVSGKYYFEVTPTVAATNVGIGIINGTATMGSLTTNSATSDEAALFNSSGALAYKGSLAVSGMGVWAVGTAACVALDLDKQLIWVRSSPSGNWNASASANPATGVGGVYIPLFGASLFAAYPVCVTFNASAGTILTVNFGDGLFAGAVPAGFTAGWPTSSLTTTIGFAGLAREALVATEGTVYFLGLAREALVGGDRVESWIKAMSSIQGQLTVTGGVVTMAAGAGGGGAAGFFGPGEFGQNGVYDGTGGYGGAGDDYHTSRQLTPSSTGNAGNEWNGTNGSGSGGSGGSWGGTGRGGNGGVGGLYGGGGGGGGSGLAGGGLGALGGEGVIYLEYDPGTGPVVILLTKDSPTTFTIPANWNVSNNKVLIVGAGGCGRNGGLTTGGGGGGGGSVVGAINTSLYTPGQVITIDIPSAAQVCAGTKGNTVFGSHSAAPGINGNGTTAGTPSVPIPPSSGGIGSGSGGVIGGGGSAPGTGGAGGGVTTLIAVLAEAKSQMAFGMVPVESSVRQHAVSVQTWHW